MTDRFQMATALIRWARKRFREFEAYEYQALATSTVTTDLRIATKEILEHPRSALDYCARDLYHKCLNAALPGRIYFPIASTSAKQSNFASLVNRAINGLSQARPDLLLLLESFQAFASDENWWLPDFAELCNENKHEQLSIQRHDLADIEEGTHEGKRLFKIRTHSKAPLRKDFRLSVPVGLKPGIQGTGTYIRFDTINEGVSSFLSQAIDGVERIVNELRAKV